MMCSLTYHIDVRSAQVLERALDGGVQILRTIPSVVTPNHLVALRTQLISRKLCGKHDLIAYTTGFHPLANPLFAFAKLIVHRRIDDYATLLASRCNNYESK
jgi:hypothetical protein